MAVHVSSTIISGERWCYSKEQSSFFKINWKIQILGANKNRKKFIYLIVPLYDYTRFESLDQHEKWCLANETLASNLWLHTWKKNKEKKFSSAVCLHFQQFLNRKKFQMAVHVSSTLSGERWCYSKNNHHFYWEHFSKLWREKFP